MDHPWPRRKAPQADTAPRFERVVQGPLRLLVAPGYAAALCEAGFDDPTRLGDLIDTLEPNPGRSAGRASTHVLETPKGDIFLKRALKGGALGPLFAGRIPRFDRVAGEIEATAALRDRGAAVLDPVIAAGVRDVYGWKAIVGTVHRPGSSDGATALASAASSGRPGDCARLGEAIGCAIRGFHDAGGQHADLAVTNLLHDPGNDAVLVIDLQGACVGAPPSDTRRRTELTRLRRSIDRRPALQTAAAQAWPALIEGYLDAGTRLAPDFAASLGAA